MSLMAAERSSAGCSRLEEFPVEERSSLGRAVSDIDWNDFDEVSIVGITRLAVLVLRVSHAAQGRALGVAFHPERRC